jgi:queuine tRNA-ribosyltransferase
VDGCRCEACTRHSRAYLHYLTRNKDLTGTRLLTLHNLNYLEQLVGGARGAIGGGRFGSYSDAVLDGSTPWVA